MADDNQNRSSQPNPDSSTVPAGSTTPSRKSVHHSFGGGTVTPCSSAMDALCKLQEEKCKFDIVLSEVHMPNMDGFKLLDHISMEMDQISVILMSSNDSKDVVLKGVTKRACNYLIKPVGMQAIKKI